MMLPEFFIRLVSKSSLTYRSILALRRKNDFVLESACLHHQQIHRYG